ncbi:HEAT repeat domain-containing protein [Nannocystis sp. ILAH1]|uniref:HEAT repeat domain-containing protein n=1 Tax=unclassified Nannocystis TaxID=2627009 RepID=UPI00226E1E4C|nr:HEAT repeat domain-containing protein [Nannocystis sp. ILAH1]MCY1067682.1 HEAT repeat domain-containing protein [Nannocystis sp. RBIL2]
MSEPTLSTLLAVLGGLDAASTIAAYCARGPASVREFLAALLTENRLTTARGPSRRAIENDAHACLMKLVESYPQTFLKEVREHPATIDRAEVVSALAKIPGADAAELLMAALGHRKGTIRWHALYALLSRGQVEVAPRLAKLLLDRDGAVRETAVEGLRRWGTADDLPALVAYTARVATHDRNAPLDAVETICVRAGQPLPASHPGARLEVFTVRGQVTIEVPRSALVSAGDPLGTVDGAPLLAPCDGVFIAADRDSEHTRVTLRRLVP